MKNKNQNKNRWERGWDTRRVRKENKKIVRIFALAWVIAGAIAIASPEFTSPAIANDVAFKQNTLPESGERVMTTVERIRAVADKHQFKYTDYLVRLAYCESRFNPKATNSNGAYGTDRGVFQINDKYHPNITDEQAFDIEWATKWTIDQINAGRQHLWACDKLIKGRPDYIAQNK